MKEYKIEREGTAEEQMMKLGLVTSNIGKYEEFKRTLKKIENLELILIDNISNSNEGSNIEKNAQTKALTGSMEVTYPVIATDEGLFLDFLPKSEQPGAYISRIIGPYATDEEIIEHYTNLIGENKTGTGTIIKIHNGEGLIAKKRKSTWMSGTRTTNWLKIKNWFYVTVIVTKFDKKNGYFTGAVYQDDALVEVVLFRHGLKEEEFNVLKKLFEDSGTKLKNEVWELAPSICVEIACIDFLGGMLREPRFHTFKLNVEPEECTWEKMLHQLKPIPESVQITHPDKPIFQSIGIVKEDYLYYLQSVAPLMLSFLRNRPLTLIRYPHGVPGESFYQKSSPEKVPDFVSTTLVDDTYFILCNNIETLLWLGNQLAIEFHIPFQPIQTVHPTEIVFDLDPPSVDEFSLAVEAALQLKAIFDQFELKSFIKTSGGKGMQIYIPIPTNTFSYEQTGLFTKFVCDFLVEQNPKWFTIERLKKNRHNKLYLDYVQHREGKTIVAPYSPRGNAQGLIATPLHWDEVNRSLKPQIFSIPNVLARIKEQGNPFLPFRDVVVENEQSLNKVLQQLQH